MFSNKEIKKLQEQVGELSEKIDKVLERQNSQFTDIMLHLKEGVRFSGGKGAEGTADELYEDAKEAVIEIGKASTSFIQRILGVGYSRAAKLIDTLEEEGVISPANGDTPRKVLVKSE